MAAELARVSSNQLQKLAQSQSQSQSHQQQNYHQYPNPNLTSASTCMWNPKAAQSHEGRDGDDDDDSWEVRAFAEDTGNAMGTTWPPRSYSCTFCRREFRSAQALGGHMNVHRRDRARLHQTHPPPPPTSLSSPTTASSTLLIPTQEFAASGGFCLLYQLPPTATLTAGARVFTSTSPPSAPLLSVSPYPASVALAAKPPSISFPITPPGGCLYNSSSASASASASTSNSLIRYSTTKAHEPSTTISGDNNNINDDDFHNTNNNNSSSSSNYNKETSLPIEELDLELRLGNTPTTS